MKPLGTITMCFPHVDEVTRNILETTMDEAENFADFTERLCERVKAESVPPLLEYLTVFFLSCVGHAALVDTLEKVGKVPDLAEPLLKTLQAGRGLNISWDAMRSSLLNAMRVTPNDWIACQLYLTWRSGVEGIYPESDVDVTPIDIVKSNVNENEELHFFKSHLLQLEAGTYGRGRKRKKTHSLLRDALTIAKEFDDQVMATRIQVYIASLLKHTNLHSAIDLYKSSKEECEQLGYKSLIGHIQFQLGHIMGFRGEFDAAIEHLLESISISESLGLPTIFRKSVIAFMYNQIGVGEKALELANTGLEGYDSEDRRGSYPQVQYAWALINLGRYDEASDELAIAQEIALKSGNSSRVLHCRYVEGILDKAENNLDGAISCFEEVLEYLEDDPTPVFQNICLINLTEIEIELLDKETLDDKSEMSGPWMQKLFEHSKKNDLPGIAARAMILKARLRDKQGQYDEVHKILKEVQNIAQAPSMNYLKGLILTEFPDLIV